MDAKAILNMQNSQIDTQIPDTYHLLNTQDFNIFTKISFM